MKRLLMMLVLLSSAAALFAEQDDVGVIEVVSKPAGAEVYVEGFFSGSTPATIEGVPEGPYRVVVKSDDYGDYAEDIVVEKLKTTTVEAALSEGGYRSPVRAEDDYTPVVGKDARKPFEKAKATKKLREYRVLEIGSFLVKSEDPLEPDRLYAIFHDLAEQLDEKTKFTKFVTNYTQAPSERWSESALSDGPALVLTGVITEYQKGSQTKRYLVGFGAGKTRAYCLFRLVDKATGEVVFERMENGSVSGGLFGGSSSGAMKEIGQDIAKAIGKNW
jgi:hypothetical protein